MKFSLSFFTLWISLACSSWAQSVSGQIKSIDASGNSFSITGAKGDVYSYRTKFTTEVVLNGQRANLKDLPAGTSVLVTPGEKGFAARIVSPAPGAQVKPAPAQSVVKLQAMWARSKPVLVGAVSAGQKVTVTPNKVWWSGGGSRKGAYCDWRGYPGSNVSGLPWMAVVAAVGTNEYVPKDDALTFTVATSGVLTIYANDTAPEDNDGQGLVTVSVTSP